MFYDFQKMRQGFSPMMALDALHQGGNFLLELMWAALLFQSWYVNYVAPQPIEEVAWLLIPLALLLWLLSRATWSAYGVLVAERAWLMPAQFYGALASFLLLTLVASYVHLLAFIVVFLGVLFVVGRLRDAVVFYQPQYIGKGGRYFRSARWIKRYYRNEAYEKPKELSFGVD